MTQGGANYVSFVDAEPLPGAMARQAIMIASAIGITLLVLNNGTIDRALCGLVGIALRKTTSLGKRRFQRMLQLGDGLSVASRSPLI
jgi:hypothetical protein